jgi:3-oxoacyl-(acyl-carrier-protein) synthase/3-hydroxymyristoyl/3-hydroxydecanoyl-(acyl carrier protein) dehydratase/1-acyl-sn-glycerol-3-phosphate acyltransferase
MSFEPIAIVGRSCLLPGGIDTPEGLWDAVVTGRDLVGRAPADRWGLPPALALCSDPSAAADRSWSDRGGYVTGIDVAARLVADPFPRLPSEQIIGLDPLFQWVLHTGRAALRDAGHHGTSERVSAVFGNLSFPSSGLSRFAEGVWLGDARARLAGVPVRDPRDRFMSGLPAATLATALGLGSGAYAIDAACASALYAIAQACDQLHDRQVDLALAGAVCRADDLFIHVGFCALQALSKSGTPRPFSRDADGLVPAEGAVFFALKRLSDAQAAGDRIWGVIRGIGLSNDARGRGMLAPASEGQQRAIRRAWQVAGEDPRAASLLECHATGTSVGDATEIESLQAVFGGNGIGIGSLKSNLGHLITAAGAAGMLKVLGAQAAGIRPPTLHADPVSDAVAQSGFRVLRAAEPWSDDRRIAAVSAFGFGGNNAHLVLTPPPERRVTPVATPPAAREPVAVIALGMAAGPYAHAPAVAQAWRGPAPSAPAGRAEHIRVALRDLKFPPKDLEQALPQQLLALTVARDAVAGLRSPLPRERTSVWIGMEADPEVARYGARWRARHWAAAWGITDPAAAQALGDPFMPVLQAAGVLGTMPNIPANRLNAQLDVGGPSHVVCDGEQSGTTALALAVRALRHGEIDAAVVGATDLSCEPVHQAALAALGDRRPTGDAAVALVLVRASDARAAGHDILALLDDDAPAPSLIIGSEGIEPASWTGTAYAANGLIRVAAAIAAVRTGQRPGPAGATPWTDPVRCAEVRWTTATRAPASLRVVGRSPPAPLPVVGDAGPALTLPAHRAPPVLPPLPTSSLASAPAAPATDARMPMPPALPSALDDRPPVRAGTSGFSPDAWDQVDDPLPPPAAAAHAPTHAPPAASATPIAHPASSHAGTDPAAAWVAHVAGVHQAYVQMQAEVHRRFLTSRQTALIALARHAEGSPGNAPAPSWAPPAPMLPVPAPPPASPAPAPVSPVRTTAVAATPAAQPAPAPAAPAQRPSAPAASPAPQAPTAPPALRSRPDVGEPLPGPKIDRAGLEILASGAISEVFGPAFARQDGFRRQCRMPEPPLLLADRVTGIDAVAGSMGLGTIWTETDVRHDSWYLHDGAMPAGVMIESGQADLLLISWLGVDWHNEGKRVYRLLGCDLTYHGGLPRPGETLQYDIHVDGHAKQGDIRLFFFHYDCRVAGQTRLSVRNGQAGFFTDQELADSNGVLWDAETGEHAANARVDAPAVRCAHTSFDRAQIEAFAQGDAHACFGPGFELAQTHVRTPRISPPPMLFFDRIDTLTTDGGPWGRGYLRATRIITPDDWTFEGHFKNDPCMPGTLMFEGCLQAMAFYLTSLGFTLRKDGWRFEPVPDIPYALRCRGQVIPSSQVLTYEIFVEEVHAGPVPTVYADLLCTVDGLKAFHARRVGLQLRPDWPLSSRPELLDGYVEPKPVARADGFPYDYRSLMACAWGKPSEAFGPFYTPFDQGRHCARLPGPPYHFMSRITRIDGPVNGMQVGTAIELEYDIPKDAWYFDENGTASMPYAVLLEAALQPCGWIACFVGSALTTDKDLFFRNLDGTGTLKAELLPHTGTLLTRAKLTSISKSGGMIIESFDVSCLVGDVEVYTLKTVFGFFSPEALANQVGITPKPEERAALEAPCDFLCDLKSHPAAYFDGPIQLPNPMLLMIDRVDGWWPEGGKRGLGRVRARKDVDPAEWFFKCHFFTDPVQPGSLGLEAMLQTLQWTMMTLGLHEGMENPRFEPIALDVPLTWKYRGQVVPRNKVVTSELEVVEIRRDDRGVTLIAEGYLWVDGLRIYGATQMGMRIVDAPNPRPAPRRRYDGRTGAPVGPPAPPKSLPRATYGRAQAAITERLEPQSWLADHCPTWTLPALPAMAMVRRLLDAAAASTGEAPAGLTDFSVHRWVVVAEPTEIRLTCGPRAGDGVPVQLHVRKGEGWELAADATVCFRPPELPAWDGPGERLVPQPDPYAAGVLFHGPTLRRISDWALGPSGARATLSAEAGPAGRDGTLDALTHLVPHDHLRAWDDEIPADQAAYPLHIRALVLSGPPPEGASTLEARYLGRQGRGPTTDIRGLRADGTTWIRFTLQEVLVPKGPIGTAAPEDRAAFLRDRRGVAGVALSRSGADGWVCSPADLHRSDWLPGTVAAVYGSTDPRRIAAQDAVAAAVGVHPGVVAPADDAATVATLPLLRVPLARAGAAVRTGPPALDLAPIADFWRRWFGVGRWPVEDLYYGLIRRFVSRVTLADPASFARLRGQSVLFVANHQVGIESLLFSILAGGLTEVPTVTLAKAEHRQSWLGSLIVENFSYPGVRDPGVIAFFDRDDKASLPAIIAELAAQMRGPGRSVMVHVEGTRSLDCRSPVTRMSGTFLDMAVDVGAPIVPVRFSGGLPVAPLTERLEFPLDFGQQAIAIGAPIPAAELRAVPYKDRKQRVIDAINALPPARDAEEPLPGDPAFAARVTDWAQARGVSMADAALFEILRTCPDPTPETRALVAAAESGALAAPDPLRAAWLAQLSRRLTGA